MDQVANDFVKFLVDQSITPSELKKTRLSQFSANQLPKTIRSLFLPFRQTIHEYFIHVDNATRFCAIVDAKEFTRDEKNGLNELVEYIGKCLLQELFLMITNKEVENLKFSDVDIEKLQKVLRDFTELLIGSGFSIFDGVQHFVKGTLGQYLNNVIQFDIYEDIEDSNSDNVKKESENVKTEDAAEPEPEDSKASLFDRVNRTTKKSTKETKGSKDNHIKCLYIDKDLAQKMVALWIGNLVKRRDVLGPPLSLRVCDLLQKRTYVLIRSHTIVDKDVSKLVQWNKSFPATVEQDALRIIHFKGGEIKLEPDQEIMKMLDLNEQKTVVPSLDVEAEGGDEGSSIAEKEKEPFVNVPGNVMITKEVTIGGRMRVKITGVLCGVPRIKPLSHMKIWANPNLTQVH